MAGEYDYAAKKNVKREKHYELCDSHIVQKGEEED